jgi:hypothetical protein
MSYQRDFLPLGAGGRGLAGTGAVRLLGRDREQEML